MNLKTFKHRISNSHLAKDSLWAVFGNVVAKGLSLVAGILVARFLGKEIYGEYGMIKNTLLSIAILSTFGLGYTATKYIAEYISKGRCFVDSVINNSQKITLLTSGLMAFGLFLGADYVSKVILEAPNLVSSLRLVAIWIVFNALTTTQIGILSGLRAFKEMTRINTYIGVFTLVASAFLTYFYNLDGALLALLLAQIFNWFLNHRLVSKQLKSIYPDELSKPTYKSDACISIYSLLKFSFPITLQEAVFSITNWLISLILIKCADYGELGLYSAAQQWGIIVLYIPAMLRNVILSHLSGSVDDNAKFDKMLKTVLLINLFATILPSFVISMLSFYIASFYGDTFYGLPFVIILALLSVVPTSLSNVYIQAYMAKGANWAILLLKVIAYFGLLFLAYSLITKMGISGAHSVLYASIIMNTIYLLGLAMIYGLKYRKQ